MRKLQFPLIVHKYKFKDGNQKDRRTDGLASGWIDQLFQTVGCFGGHKFSPFPDFRLLC